MPFQVPHAQSTTPSQFGEINMSHECYLSLVNNIPNETGRKKVIVRGKGDERDAHVQYIFLEVLRYIDLKLF